MKQQEQVMPAYETPQVEIIEVEVEQGFGASDPRSMPYGDDPF